MDALEVFAFHHVLANAVVVVQAHGHVADHVLNELRVIVGALGHPLLVGPLQNAEQFARGFFLGEVDEFFNPHMAGDTRLDGDMRALVVRTVSGNLLRARAQAGDRNDDLHPQVCGATALHFTDE